MAKANKESVSKGIREKLTEMLELPKESVLDIPKLTIAGNKDMIIENYKGLLEFDSAGIRLGTGMGTIKIRGSGLLIKEMTCDDIVICGAIHSLEFPIVG
ncbi:MAG: sporulation protein YqfC [Clostridiaceae bacterium]|jgi:sporulation protein YqfC|nr:sporulation protein YqfC [Clostridiaceae bacterium]